jgi:hypothetical protein
VKGNYQSFQNPGFHLATSFSRTWRGRLSIKFNFVLCYSSVIILQQFLSSCIEMYIEICVIVNTVHIYV